MLAQNLAWCRGFCQRHARVRGFQEPGRVSPARRSPRPSRVSNPNLRIRGKQSLNKTPPLVICPDCTAAGASTPAQNNLWCEGFCTHHAHEHGLHAPDRLMAPGALRAKSSALAPSVSRRLCGKLLRLRLRRYSRCAEAPCRLRARAAVLNVRYCMPHDRWHRILGEFPQQLAEQRHVPPPAHSRLGAWLRTQ